MASSAAADPPLLFTALARLADECPERPVYTFIDVRGHAIAELRAEELWDRVLRLASGLRNEGALSAGDRVLLVYPPGLEFVEALLAAMCAELVPVPVPVPGAAIGVTALANFARDSAAAAIFTQRSFASRSQGHASASLAELGVELPWLVTDAIDGHAQLAAPSPEPDEVALLQYTSGSTRDPRGVMVTFRNLQHQFGCHRRLLRSHAESRQVFWLPHYHDFGLIVGILGAAHGNGRSILMPPLAFLRRPALWGELLTRYRATHTAAPDFGYRMLVERTTPKERAGWNLEAMEALVSAAEPIRASTVDALMGALEPCGLRRRSFAPCYGLAEHTVGATMGGLHRRRFSRRDLEVRGVARSPDGAKDAEDAVELFGCGAPQPDIAVRIVAPDSRSPLPEGRVGEIWLASDSACRGYFRRPEETTRTFRATVAGETGTWLRTGDLGCIVGGELYITGRLKELVILQGRNIAPHDVEEVIEAAHGEIRRDRVACFSVQEPQEERMVAVAEVRAREPSKAELQEIVRRCREAVFRELAIGAFVLVLAERGAVTQTTSGKIRRMACKAQWEQGRLPVHVVDHGLGAT
jgi:acyl-CoA synthetase (AMP-forming)/AMP-acid ligase II